MVDMSGEGWFTSVIRSFFAGLDSFVYKMLAGIYNIFFNVATAEVLQEQLLKNLLGRIQLILGIIILFKLVISFFSGIVNPDGFNNEKTGFGSVIKRAVVVLIMILMIVPLNIPESSQGETGMGSWNKNMNTHGILFGTLYEFQRRVLEENIIFKVINGNKSGLSNSDKRSIGENFSKDVLKTFYTVNVVYDGADFSDHCEGILDNRDTNCVCTRWKNEARDSADSDINLAYPIYFDPDSTIDMLLQSSVVNAYCDDNSKEMSYAALQEGTFDRNKAKSKFNDDTYAFAYSWFWSTIIGALFCVLMLSLTIDVAVRLFKLVLLQIISPIAILSYIDPSSEKTFKNWTKALTDAYLSLFIRIAIISLIVFIINNISLTGFGLKNSQGFVGFVSKILIYFGLIMFAKEAPKFITQALGIESKEGGGLFSGIGKMMKGIVTPIAGAAGGFATARASYRASQRASEENSEGSSHSFGNKAKAITSGIFNGVGATVRTASDYAKAKDNNWRTAMDKVNKSNAYRLQNAEEGSTWWGQKKDQLRQDFLGDSEYSQLKRQEKDLKDKQQRYNKGSELLKKLDSVVDSEVNKKGLSTVIKTANGEEYKTNAKDMAAAMEKGNATGIYSLTAKDKNGNITTVKFDSAASFGKAQADAIDYAKNLVYEGKATFSDGKTKYTAPTTVNTMIADVRTTMNKIRSDDIEYQQYMVNPNTKNKVYDENKDMVTNIKNMRDFMDSAEYNKQRDISNLQERIGKAKGNFHGNDGGQGGH